MSWAKQCKYQCGQMIIWDNPSSKFKEVESGEFHTPERCKSFKSGQLTMQKQQPVEYQVRKTPELQVFDFTKLEKKIDSIEDKIDYYTQILAKIFEKYPDAKTLSELKTENAQLRQVIAHDPNMAKKASEFIKDGRIEERVTEYKEIEGAAEGNGGNEDPN